MSKIWVIAPYGKRTDNRTYMMQDKDFDDIFQFDLKNKVIALGASSMRKADGTFSNPESMPLCDIENTIKKNHPEYSKEMVNGRAHVLWQIYNEVKDGDFVVAKSGLRDVLAFGRIFAKNGKTAFFSVEDGIKRTGNQYNPHPNFINVDWKEDHMVFGVDVFLRDRFGELRKIVASKYYSKFGRLIEQRIKELWGSDCDFDEDERKMPNKTQKNILSKSKTSDLLKDNIKRKQDLKMPAWLKKLQEKVLLLREDIEHQERAHESLVEMFYEGLGYERFVDIQYRKGRIDVSIIRDGKIVLITEVKKDWGLTAENGSVLSQAYNYAHDTGARFVVITNGDYYGIFDRDKGRTYKEQLLGEFNLSNFRPEDMKFIKTLHKR